MAHSAVFETIERKYGNYVFQKYVQTYQTKSGNNEQKEIKNKQTHSYINIHRAILSVCIFLVISDQQGTCQKKH